MATSEIILPILSGVKDASFPPGLLWIGNVPYLTLDGTDDEIITFSFRMPDNFASGLTVKWQYSMVSATTGVVAIRTQFAASSVGDNIVSRTAAAIEKSADNTVPGTAGVLKEISYSPAVLDSLAGGDQIAIRIGRENGTTGTNATGDMAVWAISLTYTTT
ncbi:hypothetical protein SAMN05216428_102388 [Nitrosospira sp. Nsp11]|uniref:hypothetical protein n=1 Tax=Nitrosospira sp. Nsp11 TaxID=1855338 RepID=UPI0009151F41|nr:hypothetical protein [Nitrosospira sp. Nsp11]SHL43193.1 hypothetical protein SAMN05216428_102388 [Nitrosospira sp. Nsp11]